MLSSMPADIGIKGRIMRNIEIWRTSKKTIKKSQRYYAHFDYRTDISKSWEYISNPQNICKHGFYPFIHYVKDMSKYSAKKGGIKEKHRDICYAAHIDRCIFQLYNFILNERYNEECARLGIQDVAVAYRTNLNKQNNIDFAKKAFQFIRKNHDCYIIIGDFTKFFDNLNHEYLKKQWCHLLHTDRLPPDHYAVFKNITQYSYFELADLLKIHGLDDTPKGRRELNQKKRVLSPQDLKKNAYRIQKNKDCGIPQGSPMSGALANLYMLEIDKSIHDFVTAYGGLYMRYSDDFIIVLPHVEEVTAISALIEISDLFNSPNYPGLELQPSKTQYYHFSENKIENCGAIIHEDADCSNRHLNFLGFTFDGQKVSLRAKTVSKHYQRMRKKAKTIAKNGGYTKRGNHISKKNLYMKYSVRGSTRKPGNFLTYVTSAQAPERFGEDERIGIVSKRNMQKIRKFLKKDYRQSR